MNRQNTAFKFDDVEIDFSLQQHKENSKLLSLAIEKYQATRSEKLSIEQVQLLQKDSLSMATKVLASDTKNIEAINLVVRIELDKNNIPLATELCQAALTIEPESATTWYSYGQIELAKGAFKPAEKAFIKCISLDSTFFRAHTSYAYTKLQQGELASAFQHYQKLNKIRPNDASIRSKLFECARQLQADYDNDPLAAELCSYYQWDNVNHSDLEKLTASLISHRYSLTQADVQVDIFKLCRDKLFNAALRKIFFCNKYIEELNRDLRTYFLSLNNDALGDPEIHLMVSLAMQSHNNEYVYYYSATEEEALNHLEPLSTLSISDLQQSQFLLLKALLYKPLNKILSQGQLQAITNAPRAPWKPEILALINHLATHESFEISDKIHQFKEITNTTSCAVREQYEINPYPRWLSLDYHTPTSYKMAIERALSGYQACDSLNKQSLEILIAGCGTGRHAIQVARYFRSVKVTAVDISLHSLNYAVGMAEEYELDNIEFIQADILELGSLNKTFDVIECSGVLHHMQDPLQGARVLQSLLNKQGIMKLALYSERARAEVVGCRNVIQDTFDTIDDKAIRDFRKELLTHPQDFKQITDSTDFYSMSGCRDLLFHVKEHRYTPAQLAEFIDKLDMQFLGFVQVQNNYVLDYAKQFPLDKSRLDLNNWELFEEQNPQMFSAMYQFYLTNR